MGPRRPGRAEKDAGPVPRVELPGRSLGSVMHRKRQPDGSGNRRTPWEKKMKRTAQEIAEYVGGELRGDGLAAIESVASLKNAGAADLSYAEEKYQGGIEAAKAGCIIVGSAQFPGRTVIVVKNPKLA